MQSTARLVGQTLGATIVTLIFAVSSSHLSVKICLYVAIGTAFGGMHIKYEPCR